MSQEALLIYKKLGLAEESTWAQGTVTPATKLLALRENGIVVGVNPQIIKPGRIGGRASLKTMILGIVAPKYTIPAYFFPTGLAPLLIKYAMGQDTATEVASFTIDATNNKINFNIGGGELTATVASSTYKAGQTQADASSLCKAIYDAIVAAEAVGTYTVSYSRTTKKFTIARTAGTFQMKFLTGTNNAVACDTIIGYSHTDHTGALSYASDTAVEHVFDHVMQPLDAITYGLSAGLTAQVGLANSKVYDITDSVVDVLKFSYKPNQELYLDAEMEARKVADSVATLSALTEETTSPLLYSQLAFTLGGGSKNLSEFDVSFGNNYKKDLHINSQYRSKFVRNGFRDVKGTFTFDLADSNAYSVYDAFLAGTQPELIAIFTGAASSIKSGFAYTLTLDLPKVQYNLAAIPGGGGQAAPNAPIPFEAIDDGTNGELKITLRNNQATLG